MENEIGITANALKWFNSYLIGCTQRVKIKDNYSDSQETPFGVPPGSILGPTAFDICVRGQPQVSQNCRFKPGSFADDSQGRKTVCDHKNEDKNLWICKKNLNQNINKQGYHVNISA